MKNKTLCILAAAAMSITVSNAATSIVFNNNGTITDNGAVVGSFTPVSYTHLTLPTIYSV